MKFQENMSMSQMMNFDKEIVNYCNDNMQYFKDNTVGEDVELASKALEHYNANAEALNDNESMLSEEQEERFVEVAKRLFNNGFVEHAGFLNSEY
jgi:hypothetical protein